MSIKLPKIDKITNHAKFRSCLKPTITKIAQKIIKNERIKAQNSQEYMDEEAILEAILNEYKRYKNLELRPLVNATGVIIHTNLGRSVIDPEILNRAKKTICHYSNLEYNVANGNRGNRYDYTTMLLCELFSCEDALVVNNNASAVFLVLNTFAKNKEVIVSRGELVEIGGSFRIPEVMANSGAILKEVGTTNKTKISDYEDAICGNTKMLLKVHTSNFSIQGFTQSAPLAEICELAKKQNLIDYYDLGSAYVNELPYALGKDEPLLDRVLQSGISLVSFSGDKLFGSVQCGIILGKKSLIDKLKKNQLLRMLRVDKITLSILNESIKAYLNKEYNLITSQRQIYKTADELKKVAQNLSKKIKTKTLIVDTTTFVGGGTMPCREFPSVAIAFESSLKPEIIELKFREKDIIGRIENDYFMLDLRTVLENDIDEIIDAANWIFSE